MQRKINHWILFIICAILYYTALILTQNRWITGAQAGFFLLPAVLVIITSAHMGLLREHVSAIAWLRVVLVSIVATLVLNGSSFYWEQWFPPAAEYEKQVSNMLHLGQRLGLVRDLAAMALVPALAEEFFFRGYLQCVLLEKAQPIVAVLISSLIFAASHLSPQLFPFYLVLGLLFGWILFKTKNIWTAVAAHLVNNAFGVVMLHVIGGN